MADRTPDERQIRRQRIDEHALLDQERQRRRQHQAILRFAIPLGIGALLLGAILFFAVREATAPTPGELMVVEGAGHVEPGTPIQYATYPPTSGTHYSSVANRGFSDSPINPGFWVHNLEHGHIVILYKCPDDCPQLKTQLRNLYESLKASARYGYRKVVIAPDTRIESRLAILAWGRRLMLEDYDEAQIKRFHDAFVDRGPEEAP